MDITEKYGFLDKIDEDNPYDFQNCLTVTTGDYHDHDVAAALKLTMGNLGKASRLLGKSRASLSNHIARSPELLLYQEELYETFLDDVEELHKGAALMGDLSAQRFFLTTKGKDRGFVARTEATGKNGGPIVPAQIDPSKMSDEALAELLSARDN